MFFDYYLGIIDSIILTPSIIQTEKVDFVIIKTLRMLFLDDIVNCLLQ